MAVEFPPKEGVSLSTHYVKDLQGIPLQDLLTPDLNDLGPRTTTEPLAEVTFLYSQTAENGNTNIDES